MVLKQFNICTAGWKRVQEYVVYVPFGTQLETTRHQGLQTSESVGFFQKETVIWLAFLFPPPYVQPKFYSSETFAALSSASLSIPGK